MTSGIRLRPLPRVLLVYNRHYQYGWTVGLVVWGKLCRESQQCDRQRQTNAGLEICIASLCREKKNKTTTTGTPSQSSGGVARKQDEDENAPIGEGMRAGRAWVIDRLVGPLLLSLMWWAKVGARGTDVPGIGYCVRSVAGGIDVATIRRTRSIQKVLAHIACGETCLSLTRRVTAYDAM